MSMAIIENGEFVSFSDFCLRESFAPTKCNYGMDENTSDNKIVDTGTALYTLFKSDKNYHLAFLIKQSGIIGFGTSEKYSLTLEDYIDERIYVGRALRVFNNFIFIILILANKINSQFIRFEGSDDTLGVIYRKATQNKFVLQSMKKNGYEYKGYNNDQYIFQRIENE